jgi:hypothetical protein
MAQDLSLRLHRQLCAQSEPDNAADSHGSLSDNGCCTAISSACALPRPPLQETPAKLSDSDAALVFCPGTAGPGPIFQVVSAA